LRLQSNDARPLDATQKHSDSEGEESDQLLPWTKTKEEESDEALASEGESDLEPKIKNVFFDPDFGSFIFEILRVAVPAIVSAILSQVPYLANTI